MITLHEGKRGCGFRQPGGLYLVSDGEGDYCPLLPHELRSCPTCGGGIKPSRGWTWIEPNKIIPPGLHGGDAHDAWCPLTEGIDRAGLIWIGDSFYSPGTFIAEAMAMGISRRIPGIPRGFVLGKMWVLLAHRKAISRPIEGGPDYPIEFEQVPAIFYLFKPERIEYVVREDDDDEKLAKLEERGVTPVRVIPVEAQTELVPS